MLNLTEEKKLFKKGYLFVGGVDEAGRGPLAGPVVAACVVCDSRKVVKDELLAVKDSKKLTAKKREELFEVIKDNFEIGVGSCDNETIDKINILQATFLSMKKAIGELKQKPDFVLIDGNFKIPNCSYRQNSVIKGDSLVFSIAAASILAKVVRDRFMLRMHEIYPQYGFDKHKGYGTKLHMESLKKHGPCPIHRFSFGPVKEG